MSDKNIYDSYLSQQSPLLLKNIGSLEQFSVNNVTWPSPNRMNIYKV